MKIKPEDMKLFLKNIKKMLSKEDIKQLMALYNAIDNGNYAQTLEIVKQLLSHTKKAIPATILKEINK